MDVINVEQAESFIFREQDLDKCNVFNHINHMVLKYTKEYEINIFNALNSKYKNSLVYFRKLSKIFFFCYAFYESASGVPKCVITFHMSTIEI